MMIMIQAIYGNRMFIDIDPENLDALIYGNMVYDEEHAVPEDERDRTIVPISDDGLCVVYNAIIEKTYSGCEGKPLAVLPDGKKLYSRCAACRVDRDGNLCGITPDDVPTIVKYFAA